VADALYVKNGGAIAIQIHDLHAGPKASVPYHIYIYIYMAQRPTKLAMCFVYRPAEPIAYSVYHCIRACRNVHHSVNVTSLLMEIRRFFIDHCYMFQIVMRTVYMAFIAV